MKIKFRQHVPDDQDAARYTVETTKELLEQPTIAEWTRHAQFHRFSVDRKDALPTLMAEYESGKHFWVVGYITEGIELVNLGDWHPADWRPLG